MSRNPYTNVDPTSAAPSSIPPGFTLFGYKPLRENMEQYLLMQQVAREAPVPRNHFDADPANTLPRIETLYYKQHPNFSYLNNPPPFNQNYDRQIQKTFINPALTTVEGFPNKSDIKQGVAEYRMNLGPVFLR